MHYELFQNRGMNKERLLPRLPKHRVKTYNLSIGETFTLYSFLLMMLSVLIVSGWSAILLVTGNTESGGPIGLVARVIFNIAW